MALIGAAGLVLYMPAPTRLEADLASWLVFAFYGANAVCRANAVIGACQGNCTDLSPLPLCVFALLLGLQQRRFWLTLLPAMAIPLIHEGTGVVQDHLVEAPSRHAGLSHGPGPISADRTIASYRPPRESTLSSARQETRKPPPNHSLMHSSTLSGRLPRKQPNAILVKFDHPSGISDEGPAHLLQQSWRGSEARM